MKRYLISNKEKFNGDAELIYNNDGVLQIIDCTNTDMAPDVIRHFKGAAPVLVANLREAFKSPTVIVEKGFEVSFELFYKDFPLKRNRKRAETTWSRMNDSDRVTAWYSLKDYKAYLKKIHWQPPMMADSYLSRREFETDWKNLK